MNTEELIRRHLETTTEQLHAPDRLEEIMREGRLRRIRRHTASVLGAAALVAAVVTVVANLTPGDGVTVATTADSPPPTSPSTMGSTTVPTVAPPRSGRPEGVLVAADDGLTAIGWDGRPTLEVAADPLYPVAMAFPDQMGGIVFQHATTPMAWEQGTLLWLPAGEGSPRPLAVPPPGGRLVPVGPARRPTGDPLFVYLRERPDVDGTQTTIMAVDLTAAAHDEIAPLGASEEVTAGGDLLAVIDRADVMCPRLRLSDLQGRGVASPLPECLPVAAGVSVAADGSRLAVLVDGVLTEYALDSGAALRRLEIPGAYMLTSGSGGWAVRTPEAVRLISDDREASLPPVATGWVVPVGTLEVAVDATLGSSDELPCRPSDLELPEQELPAPVAATRQRLFELAVACDYQGLAELVESDATSFTFGGSGDPAAFWVGEARNGTEPLAVLARLLTLDPGLHPDGWYAWPAAHLDNADEAAWQELEAAGLGAGIVDSSEGRAYYGYRVGIAADGTWMFFVAGD